MGAGEFVLQWHATTSPQAAKAVALVAHGLNVKPAKMGPLIELLNANGIEALSIALHGHGENYVLRPGLAADASRLESLRSVTCQLWRDEFYAACKVAELRAAQLDGVPLHLVGYSLGGLIGCDLFASVADVHFDRMVLLAPALKIRGLSYILSPFTGAARTVIPSFSPAEHRANRGAPLAAYAALYTAAAHLAHNAGPKINVPTLIFLDPKDELVSYAATERFVERAGLTNWRLHRIKKDSSAVQRYHHLLIDAASAGQFTWAQMAAAIVAHLRN